jgi:hypothetical protein
MRVAFALSLLAACGNDPSPTHPDAPAPMPDAAPAGPEVALTITLDGKPLADQAVVFQNADSSVVASTRTDASGVTRAALAPGGFVTAVVPDTQNAGSQLVDSFVTAQPDDDLHLALTTFPSKAVSLSITFPADPDPAVTSYELLTSCGITDAAPPTATVDLQGCGDTIDLVIASFDKNQAPVHALYAPSVSIGGGSATVAGSYKALLPQTFTYTNVSPVATRVDALEIVRGPHGTVFFAGGSATPANGQATVSTSTVDGAGLFQISLHSFHPHAGVFDDQSVFVWGPSDAGDTIDDTDRLADYTSAPSFSTTNHDLTWTVGDGRAPNTVLASVFVSRNGTSWLLRTESAGGHPAIAFPVLPLIDGFDFNPGTNDSVIVSSVDGVDFPGGYDAIRTHALDDDLTSIFVGTGRMRGQQLDSSPGFTGKMPGWTHRR